eukprot:CAMPEP_0206469384 /NCGR_PEP_ID=MMETSP0324_2-20121206/30238_1 /ASSEMBLY_ACC=CAM_ASM_000836 /TAXON_ID=2866 /ORGANISM="Crypthecodinium cohnii, Strain Seligo" /LENGTH=318 /DNA_ID=CAMNT_0053943113 /DNA_START=125 /DNA_END=1081 /DNA_ORIENTATION=-
MGDAYSSPDSAPQVSALSMATFAHMQQRRPAFVTPSQGSYPSQASLPLTQRSCSHTSSMQWKFVWGFSECFKANWDAERSKFAEIVQSLQGGLVCVPTSNQFDQWLSAHSAVVCILMVDWLDCRDFLQACRQAPAQLRPKYVIIRCQRASTQSGERITRTEAQAWLQENPLPQGMRYFLCSRFDAGDGNTTGIMAKVAKVAASHSEARPTPPACPTYIPALGGLRGASHSSCSSHSDLRPLFSSEQSEIQRYWPVFNGNTGVPMNHERLQLANEELDQIPLPGPHLRLHSPSPSPFNSGSDFAAFQTRGDTDLFCEDD